jgi:hypothetical protein
MSSPVVSSRGLGLGSTYPTEEEWRVVTQDIIGSEFRAKFADAYAARAALLAAFADRNRQDTAATNDRIDGLALDSGVKVFYENTPPTGNAAGDIWFNTDTTTACPDLNCKGHAADASGNPLVGSYPHRGKYWAHKWTDLGSSVFAWRTAETEALVIASEIAAGAIVADKIAANAVNTSKLTVSNFDNLVPNPTCAITTADPTTPEGAGLFSYGAAFSPNGWYRRILSAGASPSSFYVTGAIPAAAGDVYYLEARGFLGTLRTNAVRIVIRAVNAAGGDAGSATSGWLSTDNGNGEVLTASLVCPAGTASIMARVDYVAGAGSVNDAAYFSNFYLRRKLDNNGITTIDGGKITTGIIDAARINAINVNANSITVNGQTFSNAWFASTAMTGVGNLYWTGSAWSYYSPKVTVGTFNETNKTLRITYPLAGSVGFSEMNVTATRRDSAARLYELRTLGTVASGNDLYVDLQLWEHYHDGTSWIDQIVDWNSISGSQPHFDLHVMLYGALGSWRSA